MKLDSNNHSVFLLYYHLVLVTKYRRAVLDDEISDYLRSHFERIGLNYNITVVEWKHDKDHIHVMFKAYPNTEITKFINSYKSVSSRLVKKDYPQVKKQLWKEMFWSKSSCLLTTGGAPIEVIKKYIQSQGQKIIRKVGVRYGNLKSVQISYLSE
ncbi:MAG: IS200/IS605 family transposase [Lactobacillales bacterium]|jgi:putative transposase|nr:IS200/IS605 family transposase [Lactobacillales bacterium]